MSAYQDDDGDVRSFGDTEAGFSTEHDASARVVRVRTWGFWRLEVATLFARNVATDCRAAGLPLGLLIDVIQLLPQRDEGQAAFGELMTVARGLGLRGTVVVGSNIITKMQLLRIAKERGVRDWSYFASDLEAMANLARR